MIIYSEILNKEFKTVDECLLAEKAYEAEQEAKRKAEVEREKALKKAHDKAIKAINEYCELAGFDFEETDNGFTVSYEGESDRLSDEIWDEILEFARNW